MHVLRGKQGHAVVYLAINNGWIDGWGCAQINTLAGKNTVIFPVD